MDEIQTTDRMPFLSSFTRSSKGGSLPHTTKVKSPTINVSPRFSRLNFAHDVMETMEMLDGAFLSLFFSKQDRIIGWRIRKSLPVNLTEQQTWIPINPYYIKGSKKAYWHTTAASLFRALKLPASMSKGSNRYEIKKFVDKYNVTYYFIDLNNPVSSVVKNQNSFTEVQSGFFS
jgi:hypothetical protein